MHQHLILPPIYIRNILMNSLLRKVVLATSCLFGAMAAPALDYGVDLSNDTMVSFESPLLVLSQTNRVRPWIDLPFGEAGSLYVAGFYEFSGAFQFSGSTIAPLINPLRVDFDRVDFEGSMTGVAGPSSVLSYTLGRATYGDFSAQILTGLSDGGSAELAIGNMTVKAVGGYRGLIYKTNARSFINASDQELNNAPLLSPFNDSIPAYLASYFAPKRAFGGLGIDFAEIIKGLDGGAELWGQLDLTGSTSPTNTGYFEPHLALKIGRLVSWRGWGIYELGYGPSLFSSAAAGSQFELSLPQFMGLRLSQNTYWASGAANGLKAFTPIRTGTIGSVNVLPFSDVISASLESFLSPAKNVYVGLSAVTLFRASDNTPSSGSFRIDASGNFLGFESNALVAAYPASDMMLSAGFGIFVPNTATMYVADAPIKLSLSLSASLSI